MSRKKRIDLAERSLDAGDFKTASEILEPLVNDGVAEAQFLASTFSLGDETVEEFEARAQRLVQLAASQEHPQALYVVGMQHDLGEGLPLDQEKAARLFHRAAEKGHVHSQYIHGVLLLYGGHGIKKDEALGVRYLHRAAEAGHEDALLFLAEIYEEGKFGLAKDEAKAKRFQKMAKELEFRGLGGNDT